MNQQRFNCINKNSKTEARAMQKRSTGISYKFPSLVFWERYYQINPSAHGFVDEWYHKFRHKNSLLKIISGFHWHLILVHIPIKVIKEKTGLNHGTSE